MAVHSLYLLLALILSHNVVALQVTPNSPCSSVCLDSSTLDESDPNSSNTESTDIVCEDTDLTNTSTGSKWKQCMTCLQTSTFEQGSESDQYWFIYNLRYSFDHCVYGFPNGTGSGSNPCETSTACGALKTALEDGDLSTTGSQFGYCDDGAVTGEFYSACLTCVGSSGDTRYIANEAGCLQRPNVTSTLGLNDTVFSAAIIGIVDPSKKDESTDSVQLSTAAIAGIAIGAAALLLVIAAIIFIRMRRRKNRANLGIEPRWGRSKKSHKRNSSFSFHCRKILASPMSPKFFRDDLTPVEEEQQQYGSLNGMAQSQVSGVIPASTDPTGRRFIESKQKPSRPAYEQVWSPQDPPPSFNTFGAPVMTPEQPDRQPAPSFSEKKGFPEKGSLSIDTTLVAPPPARQSPKQDVFAALIASSQPIPPGLPFRSSHAPSSHGSIVSATSPQSAGGGNKLRAKPSTTTMSSQGSGYPSMMTPCSASPLLKQKHGWPSPREAAEVPWFPPPPPGPPPKSSALKSGRKGAGGSGRKRNRDSGSPVETHQIQISFPAPPQR
ncbi:hypothetical protein J7T55_005222 [Diaporthe amygdali]|uniref:uncharacterized protein n=1 Tax=Phomopsis amygdali TaxID=1214568 RepID=UPI0022FEC941|nr:uncharacterized protein J7T55_005222 [Diaporthe amygdali]KAJ0116276.1 hypothetical protein J7T55_005222 [Diaporthe amygdali]